MPFFVTPNVIAIVVLTALAAGGLTAISRRFRGNRKRFTILKLKPGAVKKVSDVLKTLSAPFTLEIAVHQLGKEPTCYISVPSSKSQKLAGELDAKEVDEYDLYYPGGAQFGAYIKGKGALDSIDIGKIDFTEVNEIGEAAVVQFVFNKKKGKEFAANVRILVSAPSSYQAKTIMSGIKASLPGFEMVEIKSGEFMRRVNLRKFNAEESVILRV